MKVTNGTPTGIIAEYVERVLIIEDHRIVSPFSLPLFANGSPTLVFATAKGTIQNNRTTYLTLFGQTILPETFTFTEDFSLIAYFFKPYALASLFGITGTELTDRPIDLNLLDYKKTISLQDQLLNAPSTQARLDLLDTYIINLINTTQTDCAIIKYASTQLTDHPSANITSLAQKDLYLTLRTFQRMFEKQVGISPNLYKRIRQFNSAFQQLNNRSFTKLSDLAFANGYADQSHFIRTFKEFTNLTPNEYLNLGNRP
ncbi:MAG: helix-turn-helix transcriptional regulator [Bacteroidetes bacterium]|nr:helix-turn-helix transcriptional regulator [Bacteroidota bacterium]